MEDGHKATNAMTADKGFPGGSGNIDEHNRVCSI